jgi:hypothetical protein
MVGNAVLHVGGCRALVAYGRDGQVDARHRRKNKTPTKHCPPMRVLDQREDGTSSFMVPHEQYRPTNTGSRFGPGVAGEAGFGRGCTVTGAVGRACLLAMKAGEARQGSGLRLGWTVRRTQWGHGVAWGSSAGGWHDSKASGSREKGRAVHRWIARCRLSFLAWRSPLFRPHERWSRSRLRDPLAWRRLRQPERTRHFGAISRSWCSTRNPGPRRSRAGALVVKM